MPDEDEDLAAMAWPGFVDILSSVIIMFIFFVMVVASALYFHIIIFKSKILAEISESTSASSTAQELAKTNRSLMKKVEELTEKLEIVEQINEDNEIVLFKQDSGFAESQDQLLAENEEERSITIFYGADSISITKESEVKIGAMIDRYSKEFGSKNTTVNILSNKDPNSVNDVISRRLAVARMLNARNLFLSSDIPPNQVSAKITDKEAIGNSFNWVTISFNKK